MDRAKKKFASAIDGLRSLHNRTEINIEERVQPEHCCLTTVVRHGLPDDSRCMAFDPVQRLMAIGTGRGQVRIIGDAGVDYLLRHESESAVLHMQFLINEGGLITACANDMIHLWNYRQKVPEVVHSVQLNKEAVTAIHLPISGKWLYVGTDKGNVYFVSVATFQLSSYVINWNKAIDLSCRIHPGPVRQLSVSPQDPTKILIAYDKGVLVQWNLANKEVDRFPLDPPVKSVCWHYDGRQLLTGNVDGSICVYNIRKTSEYVQRNTPHGVGPCRPIHYIEWKHIGEQDQVIVFSGGMPTDDGLPVPALTILRGGKSATVLEMDHPIIAFQTLPQLAYNSCPQQPHSVAVLLKNDFMVLDLQQQGHPMIESPHAMNIHESPVTCIQYYSDCPLDLIGALTLVGTKQRKKDYSQRAWPISGGLGRECATGHQELVITGHKDGTVRFWQETGEHLQVLYRLKSSSHFERLEEMEVSDKVSHSVKSIEMCLESRQLLVAGVSGQVTLFRFTKIESMNTIAVVNIPLLGNASTSTAGNGEFEKSPMSNGPGKEMRRQRKIVSRESTNSLDTSDSGDERIVPFKVRGAPVKRPPGFQPELACFVPWPSHSKVDQITAIALNSCYGVIAIGTTSGLALVDTSQCALIYAWTSSELYGSEPTPAIQLSSMQIGGELTTSPLESPISLDAPKRAGDAGNGGNGQQKQRSFDSRRPQLFKTQSVVENGSLQRGETRDSPSLGRQMNSNASPSTSSQSLERSFSNSPQEAITSLCFIHSFSKRNDPKTAPCLWVGTSAGTSLALNLILPEDRFTSTVVVAPSGTVVKMKGQVLYQCFMDSAFCILSAACENYKEKEAAQSPERSVINRVSTKASLAPQYSSSIDVNEDVMQILIVVAENEVKCVALPTFSQLFSHKCEDIPLVKAYATHVRGHPVLMCLSAAGQIVCLSLPSLRPLHTASLLPHSVEFDDPIVQKTAFSDHGLGVYMASPSEMEKYTICQELADQTQDSLGELFVPCEMPEPPKNNSFLKGVSSIFGGTPRQDSTDIDVILSEPPKDPKNPSASSSTVGGMRSVARTIPGPSMSMDRAHAGSISAGQAAQMAMQNLNERTEKLNATVDATENLKNSAMNLTSRTGKLVEKYEKKKWYNF